MIFQTYQDFRGGFAEMATHTPGGIDVEFIAPNIIRRGATWFGWQVGYQIKVVGSASNDGYYTAESYSGVDLTIVEDTLVNEAASTTEYITGLFIDNGGYELWPVAQLRASGFDGGILPNNPWPYQAGQIVTITVNGQANDAVSGVDEYDWYVSQRTDVVANQYFQVLPYGGGAPPTKSGSINLFRTALALSEFAIEPSSPLTMNQRVSLFKHMAVYVQRRSDKAIQWMDLFKANAG